MPAPDNDVTGRALRDDDVAEAPRPDPQVDVLRLLAQNAKDVIFRYRLGPEPGFDYVSPAVEDLTGYTPDEFYADPELGARLMHPDHGAPTGALERSPSLAERPVVVRVVHRDGSVRWTEQRNFPVTDGAGAVVAIEGIARDITDQKEAMDRLRASEAALAEAQEVAHLGSWEWDIRNNVITWSDELYRLYGLRPQEFEATYEAYLERVHPDDRELARSVAEQAFQDHESFEFDHRLIQPDGTLKWLRGRGKVIVDPNGEPIKMVGTALDITAHKESEERFRSVLEAAPDAMVGIDAAGAVSFVNGQCEEMFSTTRDQLVGMPAEALVAPEHRDKFATMLAKATSATDPTRSRSMAELDVLTANGSTTPAELSMRALTPLSEGDEGRVAAAFRDISERREVEAERRRAEERDREIARLREQEEFRSRLVNIVSHELNTPLTPLRIQLHILRGRDAYGDEEAYTRAVDVLDRNTERLTGLVRDLLEVARIQSGRLDLELDDVDMAELVGTAVRSFQDTAAVEGVKLDVELPEGALVTRADPSRIAQVVDNIISNAIKYSHRGERITASVEAAGGSVSVTVRDHGVGLTDEQIDRLFKPFSQVHDTDDEQRPGTGLGLYICRGIIDQHGGRIWAKSRGPGEGTEVGFTIPLTEKDRSVPDAP